jgi:hypothetical protein
MRTVFLVDVDKLLFNSPNEFTSNSSGPDCVVVGPLALAVPFFTLKVELYATSAKS